MIDIEQEITNQLIVDSDNKSADADNSDSSDKSSLSELNDRMKKEIVKFSYKRKNGSVRKAKGTLQKNKMPQTKSKPGMKKPDSIFVYWDIDRNNYRSFRRKNFLKTLSESQNQLTFVYDIGFDRVKSILDTVQISNRRYNRLQFDKYIGIDNLIFCGIFENRECRAMAVLDTDKPSGHIYVAEYQAFVSGGFAARLLIDIIKRYSQVWLMADPTADISLIEYYRQKQFKFLEYVLPNSIWGPAHFFLYERMR